MSADPPAHASLTYCVVLCIVRRTLQGGAHGRSRKPLAEARAGTATRRAGARGAVATAAGPVRLLPAPGAGRARHGDRGRDALSPPPPAGRPGRAGFRMADRGRAAAPLLPPQRRWRGAARRTDGLVERPRRDHGRTT